MIFPKMAGFKTIQLFKHLCGFVIYVTVHGISKLDKSQKAEDFPSSILKSLDGASIFLEWAFRSLYEYVMQKKRVFRNQD
jgi:hypothetical protein